MERLSRITVTTDASGAQQAAREGMLVMVVDVIDMSTSLESALDAGAYAVLGSSPDFTRAPVKVFPEKIGREAVRLSKEAGKGIIIISEPRAGTDEERLGRCQKLIRGIEREKGFIEAIIPNMGAEVPKLAAMENRVVVAVTDTGGVAFDAAFIESKLVITGTVARTYRQKGLAPAQKAVKRAEQLMAANQTSGVAIVAASRNSMEDVLAAQFIASLMLNDR
ncbi:MAG: hypothetical protein ACOX6I_06385 [Syntrophomonadaceae bacterium]|jgi:hypothetical protein